MEEENRAYEAILKWNNNRPNEHFMYISLWLMYTLPFRSVRFVHLIINHSFFLPCASVLLFFGCVSVCILRSMIFSLQIFKHTRGALATIRFSTNCHVFHILLLLSQAVICLLFVYHEFVSIFISFYTKHLLGPQNRAEEKIYKLMEESERGKKSAKWCESNYAHSIFVYSFRLNVLVIKIAFHSNAWIMIGVIWVISAFIPFFFCFSTNCQYEMGCDSECRK